MISAFLYIAAGLLYALWPSISVVHTALLRAHHFHFESRYGRLANKAVDHGHALWQRHTRRYSPLLDRLLRAPRQSIPAIIVTLTWPLWLSMSRNCVDRGFDREMLGSTWRAHPRRYSEGGRLRWRVWRWWVGGRVRWSLKN